MAAENLPPPFIYVPNLANLRDVGGLPVQDSNAVVKRGIVYRSADPTLCTEDEIRFLHQNLGISHIFDLRSEPEHERQGSDVVEAFDQRIAAYNASGDGRTKIQRYWTPVFATEDYSPESIAIRFRDYGAEDSEGFVRAYSEILSHGGPSYAKILRQLGKPNTGGVLLHCTAGKDRTGVIIAVILLLLGVTRKNSAEEYHLTETGLLHRRPHFIERIMSSGAFEGEEGMAAAGRMVGARAESMEKTLVMVEQRWGGVEAYVKNVCGLSDAEIQALRSRLVEQTDIKSTGGGNTNAAFRERRAVL